MTQQEQLEAIIGANMGCYYREATKSWLRQVNDLHTKKYSHLEDMTAEVLGTTKAITALIQEARDEGYMKGIKDEVECKVTFPHDHPHLKYEQSNSGGSNNEK